MFSVLYVDDERDLLEMGKLFLEQSPEFHIEIAISAKEALELPEIHSFDAIVSDYQMPEMDGIEFLKAVRERFGDVPFILFTGRGREDVVIDAINHGADFYLQKGGDVRPQFAELSHKIRQAVARRRAEHSLIESEKRLSDIIGFLPDATLAINREGIIIAWNRAIEEMTGYPASVMLGKGDHEYAIPFYGERRSILIDLIFESDEVIEQKYSHIHREKDILIADTTLPHLQGREVTLLGKASPLYNIEGEIVGAIEAIRDITEQKKAVDELRAAYEQISASEEELREQYEELAESEQKIRESESKYRDLFENSVLGIFRTTPEGKFSAINITFARIAGYGSPQEMIDTVGDIRTHLYVDPEDRWRFEGQLKSEGKVKEFEARFYHHDGNIIWVKINAIAVRDPHGAVLYYEGTIEDIEDQKKAEAALKKEKTFSDAVIDSVPGLLYLYDSEGRLIRWNKSHETITGYSAEELAGMHLLDWYRGDDDAIATISAGAERALKEGYASAEANLQVKDGKKIPFFFTAQRLEIDGKIYFTGVGIDITDRMKARDELRNAYEQVTATEEELRAQYEELADNQVALRASEEKFRDLVETSPDLIWEMDAQGVFTYMSPQSTVLMGFTPADIVGKTISSFIASYALPEFEEIFSTSVRIKKPPRGFDVPIRCSDGHLIIMDIRAVALLDREDQFRGFRGIARDITEKKRAADELQVAYEKLAATEEELRAQYDELAESGQQLRESEEQLRNVFDHSPFGMHFYDLKDDGTLIFTGANPAADTILGLNHREFTGQPIVTAFPGLAGTEIPDQYRRVAADGIPWHTDQTFYHEGKISGAFSVTAFRTRPGAVVAVFFDITERKRAEEVLREKNEEINQYFITSLDLLCVADTDGYFRRLNPEWEKTLGYPLEELEGKRFLDLIHPDDLKATLATVADLESQKEVLNFTNRYRHKNGTYRWLEWRSYPKGKQIFAAARDITAKRESEEQYRKLFEQSNDAIFVADPKTQEITDCNRKAELMTGFSRSEIVGMHAADFHPPDVREATMEHFRKFLEGMTSSVESVVLTRDGRRVPVSINAGPVEAGGRTLLIGTFRDITGQKQAEAALRESEERYRTVVENIEDAFVRSNAEGMIVMASPSAARMLGCNRPEELISKPMAGFYRHPEVRQLLIEKIAKDGKIVDQTIEFLRKDGSTFWGSINAHFLHDEKGEICGVEGFIHDISEYRAMEQAFHEASHKLSLLNSMTRHDVLNQLTILQGYAQIAVLKKGDPVITDYLEKIITAADTIARQIEFTRMYQELGGKAPVWMVIGNVIAHVDNRVPVTISGTCKGIEIFADPMLERVFFNLFDNAVRHGVRVTEITVRCEREPDSLLVIVEDNGSGIPVAMKEKIFERGIGKNTGLGLFLAREILAITGIIIRETGISGKGARFELSVPAGKFRYTG